jgi:FixJ family two-component response regulator
MADAGLKIPTIFITGHGDIPMTVRAMKAGALEFLPKPFNEDDLLNAIEQGIARDQRVLKRREDLQDEVLSELNLKEIVGKNRGAAAGAHASRNCGTYGLNRAHLW